MVTVAELQAELTELKTARSAILAGAQSYQIAGRTVTKANLYHIREMISDLEMRIRVAQGNLHGQAVFGGRRG